ncbi:MAG: DUF2442 domain-containing protein [Oligoflexia bacterium]|nr:DUF2442 domain-containing protein [Oligoflexia bacterium]
MIIGLELIEVESVQAEDGYILNLSFTDGTNKKVNLSALMAAPPEVFIPLTRKEEFKKVSVNPVGGIEWACDTDLSADYLLSL